MQDTLHAYRATWFNGMTHQEIYMKVKPISAFGGPTDPWEESSGKCVDSVNFDLPDM